MTTKKCERCENHIIGISGQSYCKVDHDDSDYYGICRKFTEKK